MTAALLIAALFVLGLLIIAYAIWTDKEVIDKSGEPLELSPEDIANVQAANGLARDSRGRFAKRG